MHRISALLSEQLAELCWHSLHLDTTPSDRAEGCSFGLTGVWECGWGTARDCSWYGIAGTCEEQPLHMTCLLLALCGTAEWLS